MEKLKQLIAKYQEKIQKIKETYIKGDTFISDNNITAEELEVIESEYYLLIDVVNSLNEVLEKLEG